jgi:predicted secreted acid phosphatase
MGKQLKCGTAANFMLGSVEYLRFVNDKDVNGYYISNKTLKVVGFSYQYSVLPTSIQLEWLGLEQYSISRKTLKTSKGNKCEIIKYNIKNKLEKESQGLLDEVTKDNKI